MQKKLIIVSLVILSIVLTSEVFSQHGGGMMRRGLDNNPPPPPRFDHLSDMHFSDENFMRNRLNLDDIQINSISRINKDYGEKIYAYHVKLNPLNQQLQMLLLSGEIDLEKVRSVLRDIANIELELRMLKIKHRLAIEKIFTSAQLEMLRKERRWMRRQND